MKQDTIVIILSVLLFLFLLWKEIKRTNRANLLLRLIATTVAVVMLALLFIPITISRTINDSSYKKLLLITPGADQPDDSLKQFKQVTTDPSKVGRNIPFIPDLSVYLSQHLNEIPSIHITGRGIASHEWENLQALKIPTTYTAPEIPVGIIQANWQQSIGAGERLEVHGSFNNRYGKERKLVLTGLGTRFDSVMIKADSLQSFYLSCQPAHTGNTVYELQTFKGDELVQSEKVPVIIKPSVKPRVMILSSSPDFEKRFLGAWLYENNYPVAIRNTLSRGKYDLQFLNMKSTPLNSIGSSALKNFDLIIADDNALIELDHSAAAAIRAELEKGLGLIIQSDSSATSSSFSRSFAIKQQTAQKTPLRSLHWLGSPGKKPLHAEEWISIQHDPQAQALVTDDQQSVVASCRLYGMGRIILNTASTTYSWILAGNKENYSSFWSLLISKAAKTKQKETVWRYSPAFASVDQRTEIMLETNSTTAPVIKTVAGDLYTAQTSYLPDTWTATWWPVSTGWQTLSYSDTASIFVFEKNDWSAAKQYAQINENLMQAAKQVSTIKKTDEPRTERRILPGYIFFIGFVLACAVLWWEGKKYRMR